MIYIVTREGHKRQILGIFEDLLVAQTRAIECCAKDPGERSSTSKESQYDYRVSRAELNRYLEDVDPVITYTRDVRSTVVVRELGA